MKNLKISTTKIYVSLGVLLVFIVFLVIILQKVRGRTQQPLAFNHKIHAENGLECQDCHSYFKEYASSGRPPLETCVGCHEEPLGKSEAEKALIEHIKSEKEIEWKKLYMVPEDVYFSHRRHVVLGKMECQICHGDIGMRTRPPSRPFKITMEKCMKCHAEKQADNDCIACHR